MQLTPEDSQPPLFSDDEFEDSSPELQVDPRRIYPIFRSLNGMLDRAQPALIDVLIVTIEYKANPVGALLQFTAPLEGNRDRKAMCGLFDYQGDHDKEIVLISNEKATRANIKDAGSRLADTSVSLIQGHTYHLMNGSIAYNGTTEYLTHDYYVSNPPRGLTCRDLYYMFLPFPSDRPTRRLVLTDTCLGYDFSKLPYRLEVHSKLPPYWIESPNYDSSVAKNDNNILVHFTAGSPNQSAHEADGGFFTQGFCRAMKTPRTLPNLLETVRSDVRSAMRFHKKDENSQVPQLYSSFPLNLNDPDIMRMFGFFKASTSPLQTT